SKILAIASSEEDIGIVVEFLRMFRGYIELSQLMSSSDNISSTTLRTMHEDFQPKDISTMEDKDIEYVQSKLAILLVDTIRLIPITKQIHSGLVLQAQAHSALLHQIKKYYTYLFTDIIRSMISGIDTINQYIFEIKT